MLTGSLANFLAGVAGPVAVAYSGGVAQSRSLTGNVPVALLVLVGGAALVLFVLHEAVVLVPLTLLSRSKFASLTAADLTSKLVSWVICVDLFLGGVAAVLWPGRDYYFLLGLGLLMAAAVYGSVLYARCVCASVELAPPEQAEPEPAESAEGAADVPDQRPASMPALRIYVMIAVATPLLLGIQPPSWGATFLVAIFSIGASKIAERMAIRMTEKWRP